MSVQNTNEVTGDFRSDTIAAIATASGQAGIGIVRISGDQAFTIGQKIFRSSSQQQIRPKNLRKLLYGHIVDGQDQVLDEVLVSFMKGPHTYTAEDVVEVNCHGGAQSTRRILGLILDSGARLAEPGEFTRRAFLNGRIDLSQAEAVMDVIDASTSQAHDQALAQLQGRVGQALAPLKERQLNLLAQLEYGINFMEDAQEELDTEPLLAEVRSIIKELEGLLSDSERGRLIREGILTVIVGQPNVGKSSLLNAFLEDDRAIVTDIPGTTRDSIEEAYQLDGLLLRLVDTAGIRETQDQVEAIGVDRSRELLTQADLVLALLDGERPVDQDDLEILASAQEKPLIIVVNKADRPLDPSIKELKEDWQAKAPDVPWVHMSASTGQGLHDLQDQILELFFAGQVEEDSTAVISNLRQQQALKEALSDMKSAELALASGVALDALEIDVRSAYQHLLDITGEALGDDVLDKIFQDFCIGK